MRDSGWEQMCPGTEKCFGSAQGRKWAQNLIEPSAGRYGKSPVREPIGDMNLEWAYGDPESRCAHAAQSKHGVSHRNRFEAYYTPYWFTEVYTTPDAMALQRTTKINAPLQRSRTTDLPALEMGLSHGQRHRTAERESTLSHASA